MPVKLPDRVGRAVISANKRLLDRGRHPDAATVLGMPVQQGSFAALGGGAHILLVTYKRDGTPIPTPVWFGADADRVYVWTEENAFKAKRIRSNPDVLVAPCNPRGKPLGPPIVASARVLDEPAEIRHAAEVIKAAWGTGRRLFERTSRPVTGVVYIEITATCGQVGGRSPIQ